MKLTIRHIIFFFLFGLLIIPFFQGKYNFIELAPLKGDIKETDNSYISFSNWLNGSYQEKKEKYLNETFGFRSLFVRINNQLSFWLFNKANANGVIIGKENYLFEENYIKAYYGADYIGDDSVAHRMQKLKFISDTLKSMNKNIIMVFAAGKGTYYSEYIPDKYKQPIGKTNYAYHLKLANEYNLNIIDFNSYFVANKNKSKYPLYPQHGIHWSYYGTCLVADSVIRYVESLRKIDMPNISWDTVLWDYPKESDYDIGEGMNLKFKLKGQKLAYPHLLFEPDSGKKKPKLLVISDSFYWTMYNFGFGNLFSDNHFWYYNQQVYPETFTKPTNTADLNLKEEISKFDVIIILSTDANLKSFGWGFIENTYNMFKSIGQKTEEVEYQERIKKMIAKIKSNPEWLLTVTQKAEEKGIPLDSMVRLDAEWQVNEDLKKK